MPLVQKGAPLFLGAFRDGMPDKQHPPGAPAGGRGSGWGSVSLPVSRTRYPSDLLLVAISL